MKSHFKLFCENYSHINGCGVLKSNILSVYYNLQLVLAGLRTSFMLQSIDFKFSSDYSKILFYILNNYKQINCNIHTQGTLIFLEKNKDKFYNCNRWNTKKLGKYLSYPLYKEPPNNKFISFYVKDKFGIHQLFANWYNDNNQELFIEKTLCYKDYLEKHFHCDCLCE